MTTNSFPAWSKSVEEVIEHYRADVLHGLADDEVQRRQEKYGFNELEREHGTPLWKLVLEQFDDTLVKILLVAAGVSFILAYLEEGSGEEGIRAYIEPVVILLILILNAVVGVWQESNAEKALDALKELQSDFAKVLRNGRLVTDLPARELVPGDVVEVTSGDKVPADMRVVVMKTATLRAEQASLTGESNAVMKSTEHLSDPDCELQAKESMLFSGTAVSSGHCLGVVTATGMSTEIGKIQSQIQQAAQEEGETPLQHKLNEFGELLAKVIFLICVVVWLINHHHFMTIRFKPNSFVIDWSASSFSLAKCTYYFKIAVALAVAAIPEGLPAVITTCLALGTRKMARQNAIVRKLPSVETLGCTTVICSDKTGTLTTNQMSAMKVVTLAQDGIKTREFNVTGTTYNPTKEGGEVVGLDTPDASMVAVATICATCNEAKIECKGGSYRSVGLSTEGALKVLAEKIGVRDLKVQQRLEKQRADDPEQYPEVFCQHYCELHPHVSLLEFSRDRKSMSVLCKASNINTRSGGRNVLFVKGAAECVIERCSRIMSPDGQVLDMTPDRLKHILRAVEDMSSDALRCLALAQKEDLHADLLTYNKDVKHPGHKLLQNPNNYEAIEKDMVLVGLVGLLDPPRPEVAGAIEKCKEAGICVMVITGDNKNTAEAICRSIGVFSPEEDLKGKSFTGRDFADLPLEKQRDLLARKQPMSFSRAEPKHKQDIIKILRELDEVAAMTGDGVNDAPALKSADIGVAMGIAGTEVAKEASDMVLADDNFATIVSAVAEGRSIYNNMKAFIRYMISSNVGEVASIFFTAALGLPENLIPVQLLWVNLVTDGPPATALGFNPPDMDIMQKPPRKRNEQLITTWVFIRYMVVGAYVGFATVGAFAVWYLYDNFLGIDLSADGHTPVTWYQLTHWEQCPQWEGFTANHYTAGGEVIRFNGPCDYFGAGKTKASTLSLSVLVAIEMFNALNALSEDNSLLLMPPWSNPWLLVAMFVSLGLHCVILYVPFLAHIFSIVPLSFNEWLLVLLFAAPVILVDEILKMFGRAFWGVKKTQLAIRKSKQH